MAAAGLTNGEIGQKLYIPHRTVAQHLFRLGGDGWRGSAHRPPPPQAGHRPFVGLAGWGTVVANETGIARACAGEKEVGVRDEGPEHWPNRVG
jgi:hypothetical protein